MDPTHIHLLITHLPIFGSILGAFVLIHALWTGSSQTRIAAYNVFLLSLIGGAIAYLTGEGAEEAVEHLPGIAENAIERHEDFALYALISLIVLGAFSLIGLLLTLKKSSLAKSAAVITLFISLISFGLTVRTGYLGGQIRHTEVQTLLQDGQVPEHEEEAEEH